MYSKLVCVLGRAGKPLEQQPHPDGSRLLLLPYGARVLGLFTPESDENFFWTHPALASAESARALFATTDWHNTGGDRTWLAPEVDIFFPAFPDTSVWRVPPEIDPGRYVEVRTEPSRQYVADLAVTLSHRRVTVKVRISKSWGPALNPLRHVPIWRELSGVTYAGYTQETSLELPSGGRCAVQIGLWSLVELPHGGEVLIPTYARTEPVLYEGPIAADDLTIAEPLVRYRLRGMGLQKIGVRAASSTGRLGYLYESGGKWALVVRNFAVNPSGEYIDAPCGQGRASAEWACPVQVCSVNNELGAYCELEHHAPAIGAGTGQTRSRDVSQLWAFRGPRPALQRVARELLSADV